QSAGVCMPSSKSSHELRIGSGSERGRRGLGGTEVMTAINHVPKNGQLKKNSRDSRVTPNHKIDPIFWPQVIPIQTAVT
ncbi:hypothetical protein JZU56_04125, partial [bacterium]|nr:hypothetical protein [bacterium]